MNFFTRRSIYVLALIALISSAGFYAQYRRYAYAAAWHFRHGASITFGEHKIEVPKLWWAEKGDFAGWISILRTSKSSAFFEPKIEISRASLGQVADNDDEQSHSASRFVATMSRDPQAGWTHSVVSLRAKSSTWYCIKDDEAVLGKNIFTTLTCNASRIPYTFNYQGPPEQEAEVESILATFQ